MPFIPGPPPSSTAITNTSAPYLADLASANSGKPILGISTQNGANPTTSLPSVVIATGPIGPTGATGATGATASTRYVGATGTIYSNTLF